MRDGEARRRLDALEKKHQDLLDAFNELQDNVAMDLGYELSPVLVFYVGAGGQRGSYGYPRRLAKTAPAEPEVIRKPTARCKGKP